MKEYTNTYTAAGILAYESMWQPSNNQPLDARVTLSSFYNLIDTGRNVDGSPQTAFFAKSIYEGLVVYNQAIKKLYVCTLAPSAVGAKDAAAIKAAVDTALATNGYSNYSENIPDTPAGAMAGELAILNILKAGVTAASVDDLKITGSGDTYRWEFMEVGSGSGVGGGNAAVVGGQGITVTNTQGAATVVDTDVDTTKGINYGTATQVDYLLGADGSVITPDTSVYYYTEKDGAKKYYQYTAKNAENPNSTLTEFNNPISESATTEQIYYEESPAVKSYSQSKLYVPVDTNYLAYTTSADTDNSVPIGAITLSQKLINKIGTVYTAHGSKLISELSSIVNNAEVGDVYNITEDFWMDANGSIYVKTEDGKYTKYTVAPSTDAEGVVTLSMKSSTEPSLPTSAKKYPTGTNLVWRQDPDATSYSWDALGETWDVSAFLTGIKTEDGRISIGSETSISISTTLSNGSVSLKPSLTAGLDLFSQNGTVSVSSDSHVAASIDDADYGFRFDVYINPTDLFKQKNYIDISTNGSGSTISVTTANYSTTTDADTNAGIKWDSSSSSLSAYISVATNHGLSVSTGASDNGTVSVKVSNDNDNIIQIGEDGGIYATASGAKPTWKILCVSPQDPSTKSKVVLLSPTETSDTTDESGN